MIIKCTDGGIRLWLYEFMLGCMFWTSLLVDLKSGWRKNVVIDGPHSVVVAAVISNLQ